jgi:hypothetical protein
MRFPDISDASFHQRGFFPSEPSVYLFFFAAVEYQRLCRRERGGGGSGGFLFFNVFLRKALHQNVYAEKESARRWRGGVVSSTRVLRCTCYLWFSTSATTKKQKRPVVQRCVCCTQAQHR